MRVTVLDNIVQILKVSGEIHRIRGACLLNEDEVWSSSIFGLVSYYADHVLLGHGQIGFNAEISRCVHVDSIVIVGDGSEGMQFES